MFRLRVLVAATFVGVTLAACSTPSAPTTPGSQAAKATSANKVALTGAIMAPSNIIAAGGGNVIASGGLNYRIAAVSEVKVPGTPVYLADANGAKINGVAEVTTDKDGNYKFTNVPSGKSYVVVAKPKTKDGSNAELKSLVKVGSSNAKADVSAASTLVSVKMLKGATAGLGAFSDVAYEKAITMLQSHMTDAMLPTSWTDEGVMAAMTTMLTAMPELDTMMSQMASELTADAIKQAQEGLGDLGASIAAELSKQ